MLNKLAYPWYWFKISYPRTAKVLLGVFLVVSLVNPPALYFAYRYHQALDERDEAIDMAQRAIAYGNAGIEEGKGWRMFCDSLIRGLIAPNDESR